MRSLPRRLALLTALCSSAGCAVAMPGHAQTLVPNPEPTAWVAMQRQVCTGRNGFHDPRCEHYRVVVHADGRVDWDGIAFVTTLGEAHGRIPVEQAKRLRRRLVARAPKLARRVCGVDHTHYVGIELAEAGTSQARAYFECGARYRAAARLVDRAAQTRRWR